MTHFVPLDWARPNVGGSIMSYNGDRASEGLGGDSWDDEVSITALPCPLV